MSGMFQSMAAFNYRVWFVGALVSNIGVWMQRTAQDWMVLTELTDYDAAALGMMSALQFLPSLILMPVTGMISDRFDKRKLLLVTQVLQGALALTLALMTLFGAIEMWHMYLFAGALGLFTSFDQPARQTIVGFLVDDRTLTNAVALNQTSMHGARLVGPAMAGLTVAAIGAGWAFAINVITVIGMIVCLLAMRKDELRPHVTVSARPKDFFLGFAYVARRKDLLTLFCMIGVFCMVGFNFGLSITTLTGVAYDGDAFQLGLVSTGSAIGGLIGSLLVARMASARWRYLAIAPVFYGITWGLATLMPDFWLFLMIMPFAGVASQLFLIPANTYAQVATGPEMRGRVMALFQGIQTGVAPFGALILGWMIAELGPRMAVGTATMVVGLAVAGIAAIYLLGGNRVRFDRIADSRRYRMSLQPRPVRGDMVE